MGSKGKHWKLSQITKEKHRQAALEEKNGLWKGNDVGYDSLHGWIKNHKPKSMFCEKCGKITNKLDCANISGEYKRDINDYEWLCRSCHMMSDRRILNLKQYKMKFFKYCRKCNKKFKPFNYETLCIICRWEIKSANGKKTKGTTLHRLP